MILTGSGDATLVTEALRVGADDCVMKPCKPARSLEAGRELPWEIGSQAIECGVRMT